MLDGYKKVYPATLESDVSKLLDETVYQPGTTERQRASADLSMIAFYYLLCVGEYTVKFSWDNTKLTVQFKYEDVLFFKKNSHGQFRCLPRDAPASLISTAVLAPHKLSLPLSHVSSSLLSLTNLGPVARLDALWKAKMMNPTPDV
jgi:hypothetical protein